MTPRERLANLLLVKILTSTSHGLKISQIISAKPAPVKAFRGDGGRGTPTLPPFPKMKLIRNLNFLTEGQLFFASFPQSYSREFQRSIRDWLAHGSLSPSHVRTGSSCQTPILLISICKPQQKKS